MTRATHPPDGVSHPLDAFRHQPPALRDDWIERPRVARLLDRRFTVATTTVVAPAGFGKTTALAQAVARTRTAGTGEVDLWVQCHRGDADAEVLGATILRSAGLEVTDTGRAVEVEALAEALLRFAPREVCLVLDDVHAIERDSSGMALLGQLAHRLPGNAHLLVAGRTEPPLRLARQRVRGTAMTIDMGDLEFDDHEIDLVHSSAVRPPGDAARWPVLAGLGTMATSAATAAEFLTQEVASEISDEHLTLVAALSSIDEIDDELVLAASQSRVGAAELLDRLPLVLRSSSGSYRLHDLWHETLPAALAGEQVAATRSRIAEHLLGRGHLVEAAEVFALAGDHDGLARTAGEMLSQPLIRLSAGALRRMSELVSVTLPGQPLAGLLEATLVLAGDERSAAAALAEVADAARRSGDRIVEQLALRNALNMYYVLDEPYPTPMRARVAELAVERDPVGVSLDIKIRSREASDAGDPEGAVDLLCELVPGESALDTVLAAFGLGDLGRPELVTVPGDVEDPTGAAAAAGGQYLAQAMWLRGDVPPELALELGSELADTADAAQVAHVRISTDSVLCLVALAAGDVSRARAFADRANGLTNQTASITVRAFAALADAATLLCEQGPPAATTAIDRFVAMVPVQTWPTRPYLYSLPLIYALAPSTRPHLDRCRFGPALNAALDAGQALVALLEHGDPTPARALPWNRPWLLRAHVLPPHLAALGAAAAAGGDTEVHAVLEGLPDLRRHLTEAATVADPATATWARTMVASLPARPAYALRIGVLGPMTLHLGELAVTDALWEKRERVRALLAHLLRVRRTTRQDTAAALWPDLEPPKAAANLRVSLSRLQKVLQPARPADERPWFVRADGDTLELVADGVVADVERFEHHAHKARELDDRGRGHEAIEHYEAASALYRGDYLTEWPDAEWATLDRIRLRALATATLARLGELLLARGEPERASAAAVQALGHEPLDERAGRLLVRSLVAQDARAPARDAARELLDRLTAADLEPEADTRALCTDLGLRI